MIDKTLKFILPDVTFKTLGSGRTDAKVSANQAAFELFINEPIHNFENFLDTFNNNLPQDIRALTIKEVNAEFNIIKHAKIKEYVYLFTYGKKCHPFCAPLLTTILEPLNIEIMKQGAKLFEGNHYFKSYCYKPNDEGEYNRQILYSAIEDNTLISASFFPSESYVFRVKSKGFMRNQVRLMMGALIKLGMNKITLDDIQRSLKPDNNFIINYKAPPSGLFLNSIEFS